MTPCLHDQIEHYEYCGGVFTCRGCGKNVTALVRYNVKKHGHRWGKNLRAVELEILEQTMTTTVPAPSCTAHHHACPCREADHAKQLAEREAALAVAVNAMADLSGMIGVGNCHSECPALQGGKCKCGNERDYQAIIDAANKNELVAAAVAKAKGAKQ